MPLHYSVLAPISQRYSNPVGRLLIHYSPVRQCPSPLLNFFPWLACVKHAASVRPEPGSNSPLYLLYLFKYLFYNFELFVFSKACVFFSYLVFIFPKGFPLVTHFFKEHLYKTFMSYLRFLISVFNEHVLKNDRLKINTFFSWKQVLFSKKFYFFDFFL